jgi:coenzyme F420 biosynthesis associated uncharacterized protein
LRRGLTVGAISAALALVVAQVARPRGGSGPLLDWNEVARLALARLPDERLDEAERARIAAVYNRYAAELRPVLLETVGGLPEGVKLPDFDALDRTGWLELNIDILRRVMEPLSEVTRVPNSWLAGAGRAGVTRYVALMFEFLGRRVLGQFDPQLLGKEPVQQALYLVEPNVADWEQSARLPGDDLRRWLILHEMTHAWQFAGHPWLRQHMDRELHALIDAVVAQRKGGTLDRLHAMTIGVPAQWDVVRRLQAMMTLVEGHGNLVMNLVGRRVLPSFERLEEAYRRRSGQRGLLETLIWRLTGLELKLEQYRVGEAFARAVHDRHGMAALNRAWEGPETLPRTAELRDPEAWYRRISGGGRTRIRG